MKKLISILLISVLCLSFSSCSLLTALDELKTTTPTTTTEEISVEFLNKDVTIKVGDSNILLVDAPENAELKWSSSDTSVVKVDQDGKIEGISKGSATITVQCENAKDTCFVTVKSDETKQTTTEVEVVTSVSVVYKKSDGYYWLDDTSIEDEMGGYSYLDTCSDWEIQEMINSILAHNQYKFQTDEWFDYFNGYDWYYYDTSDMSVAQSRFNKIENENYNYLAKYRDTH